MSDQDTCCLYCQTPNSIKNKVCSNCGMELPEKHPESANVRQATFKYFFWAIVIFCIVMMFYLPR